MKPTKIDIFERYQEIVDRYGVKGCKSNDYIQREAADLIIHDALYEYCGEKNAFLMVKKNGFWRVYYYINDPEEKLIYEGDELVTEIIFRGNLGEPTKEVNYLESCGFKRNLVRDQYFAKYASLTPPVLITGLSVESATRIEDVQWAIRLFNASFDKWSGDFIPDEMAECLLQEHAILIAKDMSDNRLGALHLENKQGVTWLNHVAVVEQSRGMGVGRRLVEAYIEQGHVDANSRYVLWVQKKNLPAVNLYHKKGFTYMNKSTLSMIKRYKI
jgi:GNAT superfamily N-acetyltransferase